LADIDYGYIDRAAVKVGGDPELWRRALAKERGVPYAAPVPTVDAPAATEAPTVAVPVPASTPDPVVSATSIVGEAPSTAMPPPVAGDVAGAPSASVVPSDVAPRIEPVTTESRASSDGSAAYGAVEPGNIDLTNRPRVQNEDGSVSTVRSIGVNIDGKEYLLPTVSEDGRILSDDEAVAEFKRSGRHLGVYASPDASNRAAEAIHSDQARALERRADVADPWSAEAGGMQPLSLEPSLTSAQQDISQLDKEATAAFERISAAESTDATEKARIADEALEELDANREAYGSAEAAARALVERKRAEADAANEATKNLPPIGDNRHVVQKLWGVLAVTLAGIGDVFSVRGGRQGNGADKVISMLDASVQRDIETQKANIAKSKDSAADKMSEYGIARQLLGDTQQAARFAEALRGERLASAMEVQANTLQSKTARDRGVLAAGAAALAKRQEQNDILQTEMGTKVALYQAIAAGMPVDRAIELFKSGLGSGSDADLKAKVKVAESESKINKSQEQLATGFQPSGAKLAPSLFVEDEEIWNRKKPEIKQKELDTDFNSRELVRQMGGLRDYIKANPDYSTNMNKRAAVDSLLTDMLTTYKDAKELGALDNQVESVVKRTTGDPNGAIDTVLSFLGQQPNTLATLETSIGSANAAIASRRKNNGLGNTAPAPAEPPAIDKPARQTGKRPATPPVVKRRNADADL